MDIYFYYFLKVNCFIVSPGPFANWSNNVTGLSMSCFLYLDEPAKPV